MKEKEESEGEKEIEYIKVDFEALDQQKGDEDEEDASKWNLF